MRWVLVVVGAYAWLMMILLGSIVLETFMVYPNIFHDPPASLTTALAFMKVRAPSDFYPPLGFLSWVLGAASTIAVWRTRPARRWMLLSLSMIVCEGVLSMVFFWPRNTIMFIEGPQVHSPEVLRQAALEFERLHWLRVACNTVASSAACASFVACYRRWVAGGSAKLEVARPASVASAVGVGDPDAARRPATRVGHVILMAVSVVIVIGTAVADLSALHAQNPIWPPHARFHAVWHVMHVAAVQSVAVGLLWLALRRDVRRHVSPAAAILAAYVLSFLGAAVLAPWFGASITPDVPPDLMPTRPLGLDGNLFSVLVVTPIIVAAWLLARLGAWRRREENLEHS